MKSSASRFWRVVNGISSPALLVALTAMVFVGVAMRDMFAVVRRANCLQHEIDLARVEAAAETALFRCADMPVGTRVEQFAGVDVTVARSEDTYHLTCGQQEFLATALDGAAPGVFGQGRSARSPETLAAIGGGTLVTAEELPVLDAEAVRAAPRLTSMRGVRRDTSIALETLSVGTDRDDFVWCDGSADMGHQAAGGLVVVDGNLWIAPSSEVFELVLDEDLVVVVHGNLYVCRSLSVRGPGRLLLATTMVPGSVVFRDRDASGAWSAADELCAATRFRGAIEGAGSVYLGIPSAGNEVAVDAGLVVAGELHVGLAAQVCGPLVLHHGVTATRPQGCRVGPSRFGYRPERERIPAFRVTGPSRPGLLREVPR